MPVAARHGHDMAMVSLTYEYQQVDESAEGPSARGAVGER